MNVFDPENIKHKKIIQNRINKMMQRLMNKWLKKIIGLIQMLY